MMSRQQNHPINNVNTAETLHFFTTATLHLFILSFHHFLGSLFTCSAQISSAVTPQPRANPGE